MVSHLPSPVNTPSRRVTIFSHVSNGPIRRPAEMSTKTPDIKCTFINGFKWDSFDAGRVSVNKNGRLALI